MKIKSKYKNVYFEHWDSPVKGTNILVFEGILTTPWLTHICVSCYQNSDIHVLTIHATDPYRVLDEDHSCFYRKYFDSGLSKNELKKNHPDPCRTWKIWGTTFIQELDEGYYLSDFKSEHDENIFQYLIFTQDQWIEFICPNPIWKTFKNSSFEKVVIHYLKEDQKNRS